MTEALTQERVRHLLDYDPVTGVFRWRNPDANCLKPGDVTATSFDRHGYARIGIKGKVYPAHRLAFLYMTGGIPAIVDHANGVRCDNRWANLRAASVQLNNINRRKVKSASGFKGVYSVRGKWQACIRVQGRRKVIGYFETAEAASAAYKAAAAEHYGEFARAE